MQNPNPTKRKHAMNPNGRAFPQNWAAFFEVSGS